MTRDETKRILMLIEATFPSWKTNVSKTELVNIWTEMLGDYDYITIMAALKGYIQTDSTGFAPTPGQILQKIATVRNRGQMTGEQAWVWVKKAVRNGLYGFEEEFDKLPHEIKDAIGSASALNSMARMQTSELDTVEKAQFIKSYNSVMKQSNEVSLMSGDVLRAIGTEEKKIPVIESKEPVAMIETEEEKINEGAVPPEVIKQMEALKRMRR